MKASRKQIAVLCVLLCFALLALPPLAVRLQDARLAGRALERPVSANVYLNALLEDPLLRALYAESFDPPAFTGEMQTASDVFKLLPPIKTQLDKLVLHGVLAAQTRETTLAALKAMDPARAAGERLTSEEFARFTAECRIPYTEEESEAARQEILARSGVVDGGTAVGSGVVDRAIWLSGDGIFFHVPVSASVTYHKTTGLVTGLSIHADGLFEETPDCAAILDAYRAYLGLNELEGLGDWYSVQFGDASLDRNAACHYQPDSRIMLNCTAGEDSLSLSACIYGQDLFQLIEINPDAGITASLLAPAA